MCKEKMVARQLALWSVGITALVEGRVEASNETSASEVPEVARPNVEMEFEQETKSATISMS